MMKQSKPLKIVGAVLIALLVGWTALSATYIFNKDFKGKVDEIVKKESSAESASKAVASKSKSAAIEAEGIPEFAIDCAESKGISGRIEVPR